MYPLKSLDSMYCFTSGTLILTRDGLRPIEDLQPDDEVLFRDEDTGQLAWKKVVRLFVTPDKRVMELKLTGPEGGKENIGVTAGHPFWARHRGWVEAAMLLPGDEVFTSSGGWMRVTGG